MGMTSPMSSLTQPGIEGVTDSRAVVELARKMNDHAAKTIGRSSAGPTRATVQDHPAGGQLEHAPG